MKKKKIYFIQPNSQYGNSIYFPYASGCLVAYSFKDERIKNEYEFCGFVYKREDIEAVARRIENPFFVGFSCYVWNYEYNKVLSKKIKEKYPHCIISFGGHQVSEKRNTIKEDYIDYVSLGEGEINFRNLLLYLSGQGDISQVKNLLYKQDGIIKRTEQAVVSIPEKASPYLCGLFDSLFEHEQLSFSAILETNRGCPNRCAFCDWGNIKSRVTQYSMEEIKKEIDWFSAKKIEYCYCADANFGLFPRDMEIVDYIIKKHKETGYPQKFQATYSKNNPETVFQINKKLNEAGMSKGATLSFQSMSQEVLRNIYRSNMPIEKFHNLMAMYNANGISAYSELILGLAGETYKSFVDGIEQLLESGQHMSINFFNCELLDNSPMANPEYMKRYGIETVKAEQHQYHVVPSDKGIKEYSDIVVATNTMSKDDWVNSNIFSVFIRTFHNLGLTQNIAIYLYYECGMRYKDFYSFLIEWAKNNPQSIPGRIYYRLEFKYREILTGNGSLTSVESTFGELQWPLEEASFLRVIEEYESFYNEMKPVMSEFFRDKKLYNELLEYQKAVVKTPYEKEKTLNLSYDFYEYFKGIYDNEYTPLKQKNVRLLIDKNDISENFVEYAVNTIWYGRRGGRNITSNIKYI